MSLTDFPLSSSVGVTKHCFNFGSKMSEINFERNESPGLKTPQFDLDQMLRNRKNYYTKFPVVISKFFYSQITVT